MTITRGFVSAAILAASFTLMTTTPAAAQDGPNKTEAKKKAPKVDWVAVKRAADKKREAEKKRAAAKKAAEEAEKAEAEAAEAAEDAQAPDTEESEETSDGEEAESVDAPTAEEEAEASEDHAEDHRDKRTGTGHHHHEHHHGAPSPDARTRPVSRPPAYWNTPYKMEYVEGSQVPDGYTKVERVRKGLVIGGAVTLGAVWLVSVTAASAIETEETAPLYVPIVGPFITIGTTDADGGGRAGLMINGIAQVAGAAMFISGLAATKTMLVRTKYAQVNVTPGVGSLSFDGSF